MFSAFTASVFTNRVRCNQADNVSNTNNNAFKTEERKQVREYTHQLALNHSEIMKFREYREFAEAISEALQKLMDDE